MVLALNITSDFSRRLSNIGVASYSSPMKNIRSIRMSFLKMRKGRELSELRISLDKIPKFDDTPSDFPTALVSEASLDILLLFLFNLVFFMGAFLSFMHYDV